MKRIKILQEIIWIISHNCGYWNKISFKVLYCDYQSILNQRIYINESRWWYNIRMSGFILVLSDINQLDMCRMPQVSKLSLGNTKFYFVHFLKCIFLFIFRFETFTWRNFQNFTSSGICFINFYGFYEISSFWRSFNDVIEDVNEIISKVMNNAISRKTFDRFTGMLQMKYSKTSK